MLTRRNFLNSTLGAGLVLAAGVQQTSAQAAAARGARKRVIVDAQIHLWKAESEDWKWIPGRKPQLPEPFTIERALQMMDEAGVDRAIVVPPSWPGDRNDYGIEAARRYPNRFAVMGRIPLQDPKSVELLPSWRAQPGMLGVRVTFTGPSANWLDDGTADWFWPAAEKAGLPVMLLAPGKLANIARVAERHPQLQLIIDYFGVTFSDAVVRDGKFEGAVDDTVALAKYPNVSVKLAGMLAKKPYPYPDVKPLLKQLFDAFGPRRCYWGTDITSTFAQATWRQRVTHFTEELDFLTEDDKDWVMGRAIMERLKWS